MAENKMSEIAKIFGKQLEESFWINVLDNDEPESKCQFREDGLYVFDEFRNKWIPDEYDFFYVLCRGEAEIVDHEA